MCVRLHTSHHITSHHITSPTTMCDVMELHKRTADPQQFLIHGFSVFEMSRDMALYYMHSCAKMNYHGALEYLLKHVWKVERGCLHYHVRVDPNATSMFDYDADDDDNKDSSQTRTLIEEAARHLCPESVRVLLAVDSFPDCWLADETYRTHVIGIATEGWAIPGSKSSDAGDQDAPRRAAVVAELTNVFAEFDARRST